VPYLALGIGSRADFVSNILLFIPLSFLLSGALLVDRRGAVRFTIAAVSIISFASALSVAIEFTQLFFPPRTVSLNDIVAETTGAAIGVALWGVLGPSLTAWTSAFLRQRGRPAFVVQLLTVYSAGFFVSQLMPFDLTIDLGELAQKYDEGRIVVVPFTHAYASPLALAWDYANDVVLWVPVGALAALGWTRPSGPRPPLHAGLIGAFIVGLIELGQLFVFTRYSDTTDLLTGSLGMAGGVAAAAAMTRTQPKVATRPRAIPTWWPVIGLAAWTVALAMYSWAPFDFVVDRDVLRQKVDLLFVVPFRNYYFGSEFHAFTEITRKFMLALPVGALLRLMFPSHRDRATARLRIAIVIVAAACLFTGLEAVQMLLPARFADVTDVLIAMTGVETARRLVDRLRHVTPARQESPLEVNRYAVR
jgi:glycopeptide antibiotics resistance protein